MGASSKTSSIVEYSDDAGGCTFGRTPDDVGPLAVRCTFEDTGDPCRGQSSKSALYSSLFLLREVPVFTTRSIEGLLSRFMPSVRSIISTSELESGISHSFLVGVCGTDSAFNADCTVCFHLLIGFAELFELPSICEPAPTDRSRGLAAEPGAALNRAISGCLSVVGRTSISCASGASVVASLRSSSNAPSGMSSISSRGVALIGPNETVAGGSETSGGNEAFVEISQRSCTSRLCRVICDMHDCIVYALQKQCAGLASACGEYF